MSSFRDLRVLTVSSTKPVRNALDLLADLSVEVEQLTEEANEARDKSAKLKHDSKSRKS